jgi:predicted MPP superfamily phosphohydrolase
MLVVCIFLLFLSWQFEFVVLGILSVIGAVVLFYGGLIEPHLVSVKKYTLRAGGDGAATNKESVEAKPIRLVFLSDLHAGLKKSQRFYGRIAEQVKALEPDLLVFGGDFVDESTNAVETLTPLFTLKPQLGTWFVLGNHDFLDDPKLLRAWLLKKGLQDLTNRSVNLPLNAKEEFELVGLDDSWYGQPDIGLLEKPKTIPRVLIAHEPDVLLDLPEACADIVILGHTHGGQIRLPGYGPITGLPQSAPQWLDAGEKDWKNLRIIISRGIGETWVRARVGSRPEVVVLDIESRQENENSLA